MTMYVWGFRVSLHGHVIDNELLKFWLRHQICTLAPNFKTRGKMASETFDEQNLPGHKNGDLVTKCYLATNVITMVQLFIYF